MIGRYNTVQYSRIKGEKDFTQRRDAKIDDWDKFNKFNLLAARIKITDCNSIKNFAQH